MATSTMQFQQPPQTPLQLQPLQNGGLQQQPLATDFAPQTGESLLPDLNATTWADYVNKNTSGPTAGWEGGGTENQKFSAQRDFKSIFGRNPTASELAMLAPTYAGYDLNHGNDSGGKAQVAAYYQQLSQSPTNIYNQQQNQLRQKAPQFSGQVDQLFQSNLGRAATDSEKTHFGMLLASGQDPYEIQQALQQTTEYNTKQTKDFTDQLKPQLMSTNQDYFQKYILPSIQSQNAQAGRTQDSSGYQAQLANAAQGQNYDLQNYLAQIQAGGYQNSVANASGNYQNLLGQQYGLQNANVSNQLANNAANTQYAQNMNMYQLQQQAYNNYLQRYGKRSGSQGLGSAIGGVVGGGLGAYFGGPTGALAGYQMGAGTGGAAGAYL